MPTSEEEELASLHIPRDELLVDMPAKDGHREVGEGYEPGEDWDGLGLIDFHPIVHFRSDHGESTKVEREYDWVVAHGIPHETFRDGDVYWVRGDDRAFLRK